MSGVSHNDSPAVSIIVVAHSVRHELERCLGSIAEHAQLPVETILVDNASTDGTVDWVRAVHPEVRLIELPENIGIAARWKALPDVGAPLTMFLDSDAALTPGALKALVGAMEAHPSWGLVGPRLEYEDGGHQPSCRRFPPPVLPMLRRPPLARFFEGSRVVRRHLMVDVDLDRSRPVLYVLGACMLFRTALGKRAGALDRYFFGPDDLEWCIRIRDLGGEVVYLPAARVVHSYRRMSAQKPVSGVALRHLRDFAAFQWRYRKRRRDLVSLGEELDQLAESPDWPGESPGRGLDAGR